jgi:hypothetical protein
MAWTFYNASGEALTNFGPVALTDLDIDGGTDVGEAIVDADLFIIDNGAGGTNVKTQASRIKTYVATVPIATGEYTGDGATSQAITSGLGSVQVKFVIVEVKVTSAGNLANKSIVMTSDTIVDDLGTGMALNLDNGGAQGEMGTNSIIALGSGGTFTVDDAGGDAHPNKNSQVYNFIAWA